MAAKSEQIASLFAAVGFQIDQKSVKALDQTLRSVEKRLATIHSGFNKLKGNQSISSTFRRTAKDAGTATTAIDGLTKSFKSGIGPMQAYALQVNAVTSSLRGLAGAAGVKLPKTTGVGGSRGGGASGGSERRPQQGMLAGTISSLFGGGPASFARGLIPGLGAGWALAQGVGAARRMAANENAFAALTGSQTMGRKEMEWVKQFSNENGLLASESATGYKRILASSQGTKLQGQGAKDIFSGLSLYGKTLGLSNDEMSRASTAISQMISKGKVSSEELKGQLAESLPGAVQIFADALGKPVDQMFQMMQDGKLLAEDIIPKVSKKFEEMAKRGGALDRARENSLSAQNRFMNKWNEFLSSIFNAGLDKILSNVFDILAKILGVVKDLLEPITIITGMFLTWRAYLALNSFVALTKGAWEFVRAIWAANAAIALMNGQSTWAGLLSILKTLAMSVLTTFMPLYIIMDTLLGMVSEDYWSLAEDFVAGAGGDIVSNDLSRGMAKLFGDPEERANAALKGDKPNTWRPGLPKLLERAPGGIDPGMKNPMPNILPKLGSNSGGVTININGGDLAQVKRVVHDTLQGAYQRSFNSFSEEWNA